MLRTDSNGFKVGTCRIGEDDIAMRLLRRGHAVSTASSYGSYSTEETAARTAKVGIWSGSAQSPEEFRAATWKSAKAKAPAPKQPEPEKMVELEEGKVYPFEELQALKQKRCR